MIHIRRSTSTTKRPTSLRRRTIVGMTALSMAMLGLVAVFSPAVADDGPYSIDGTVPDSASFAELDDPEGNVKELGPKNSNVTKIGVIHDAATPMLDLTNPNAQVDLRRAWLDTAKDQTTGDDWLYFAWERDKNTGSGFIAYEFMQADAPEACAYDTATNAELIADCNPWANRQAGDFMILWDQQGGSTDLYLRTWSEVNGNLVLSPPGDPLDDSVSEAAYGAGGFRGEAAVNLTDTIFDTEDCISFANTIPSTVTGNSDTADYKDTILKQAPPITNCGTVIIRKVTVPTPDPTDSTFDYTTTGGLDPATFDLTDGENQDYGANVQAGEYSVTEEDPGANFALTDLDCSASDDGNGSTITPDLETATVDFDLAAGDTVDCTYTNTLQVGALKILKQSTKSGNPLVSNAGAVFSYDSSSVTDNGTGDQDDTAGEVCVAGLVQGDYTVNETSPPDGYGDAAASQADQTVTVVAGTNCTDNLPGAGATATFTNPPLADIQVNFRDGGSGETSIDSMSCTNTGTTADTSDVDGWDDSVTHTDIPINPSPREIVCTITIDP